MSGEPKTREQETREQQEEEVRERNAALRRAAALRQRTARVTSRAFDTRTEAWQRAGLIDEIEEIEDRSRSRRARREAVVLLILLGGVLFLFANRNDIAFLENVDGKVIRYVTAALLVLIGWGLARTVAVGLAPVLMKRVDPGTAGTVGFLIRLVTIAAVVLGSLAIAGVDPAVLVAGGAFTAVVVGLAAQQTLGNVMAGGVLLTARPFRVGDVIAVQGGGINVEGTVASLGLFYTTLLMGRDRVLIPNSVLMNIAVIPQGEPDAVELTARFDSSMTPRALQERLEEAIEVPLVRPPEIELEEIDSDGLVTLAITATPLDPDNGPILASQILRSIRAVGGEGHETDPTGEQAVQRSRDRKRQKDPGVDPGDGGAD
jgi:small conductance mechanosensitive channel